MKFNVYVFTSFSKILLAIFNLCSINISFINGAKILFAATSGMKSHTLSMMPLAER